MLQRELRKNDSETRQSAEALDREGGHGRTGGRDCRLGGQGAGGEEFFSGAGGSDGAIGSSERSLDIWRGCRCGLRRGGRVGAEGRSVAWGGFRPDAEQAGP